MCESYKYVEKKEGTKEYINYDFIYIQQIYIA